MEDKERLTKEIRDSLVLLHAQGHINNPELAQKAETIIKKRIYAKWLQEKRKFDSQIEDKNKLIWELEESLMLSQNSDVQKQLEDARGNIGKLESRLREGEFKIGELDSELNKMRILTYLAC